MKTKRWTWEETGDLSPQQMADYLNSSADIIDKLRGLVEQWRLEELRHDAPALPEGRVVSLGGKMFALGAIDSAIYRLIRRAKGDAIDS
jgi:hypothetical protein